MMMTLTSSRPIVYSNFLLNKYQEEEEEDHHQQTPEAIQFHDDGPWEIKKVLKLSDVNGLSRLLIPRSLVKKSIYQYWNSKLFSNKYWNPELVNQVESGNCLKVCRVIDFDTLTEPELVFRKWTSNNSYVFQGDWSSQFVDRRKLMENDEIGMFWNPINYFFVFKVLKRADPALPIVIDKK